MGKVFVEICLISARGLRRSSSLWKLQWFAVGWIDPNSKYCTKIDASRNSNPVWKTKFSASIDSAESSLQNLALHVEVYSREPIFLRERLQGTATVALREFLTNNSEANSKPGSGDVGSFQLRKGKSNKPQGFVDVSIRVSEEREEATTSYSGNDEGFKLVDHHSGVITLASENRPQTTVPNANPTPFPREYPISSAGGGSLPPPGSTAYQPPRTSTPPPPPPPSNIGYIPTFLPRTEHLPGSSNYANMPAAGRGGGPGFGMGVGAGALAAGAVIFGDDFMAGFDFPSNLQGPSVAISTDPPL